MFAQTILRFSIDIICSCKTKISVEKGTITHDSKMKLMLSTCLPIFVCFKKGTLTAEFGGGGGSTGYSSPDKKG